MPEEISDLVYQGSKPQEKTPNVGYFEDGDWMAIPFGNGTLLVPETAAAAKFHIERLMGQMGWSLEQVRALAALEKAPSRCEAAYTLGLSQGAFDKLYYGACDLARVERKMGIACFLAGKLRLDVVRKIGRNK